MTWEQQQEPEQLRATLTSSSFLAVRLEQDSEAAVPPELPSLIVAALAGSAPELAALHGLPLLAPQGHPEVTLAAFTRLRALTLRQTTDSLGRLRAADLPASLVELTLFQDLLDRDDVDQLNPPLFVAFDELRSLRRITLDQYEAWHLSSTEGEQHSKGPVLLPPSFRVRTGVPDPAVCTRLPVLPVIWDKYGPASLLKVTTGVHPLACDRASACSSVSTTAVMHSDCGVCTVAQAVRIESAEDVYLTQISDLGLARQAPLGPAGVTLEIRADEVHWLIEMQQKPNSSPGASASLLPASLPSN